VVQHPGRLVRMKIDTLRKGYRTPGSLQEALIVFSTAFLLQVSQTAACNRLHTIERRLARWILMMRDRNGLDEMNLTQEFLSHMLGTRIAGVNEAVRALTNAGLIAHKRRLIRVIDPEGLEESACECYGVVKQISPNSM
jgi:CRP-like cAMP-binding protein